MQRVISIWLPTWSVDLNRRRSPNAAHDTPPEFHLVVRTAGPRRIVTTCCQGAAAAGVHSGLTLADARARLPREGVTIHDDDPARRNRALQALARWMHRLVPVVAPDPPDGLLLDASGCERLYHGESQLLIRLNTALRRLRIHARIAIASTPGAAWALARYADPIPHADTPLEPEEECRRLRTLPIEALRLEDEAVARLREVGIEQIGDLMRLPRRTIPSRFGEHTLLRLDQAVGHAFELIDPIRHEDPIRVERIFSGPTTRIDAIHLATRELIDTITGELRHLERAASLIAITLKRVGAPQATLTFAFSHPCRDARQMWSRIEPCLERTCLGDGVEGVRIDAPRTQRIEHTQFTRWESPRAEHAENMRRIGAMVDTLVDRLGTRCVFRVTSRASHIPESAFVACDARQSAPAATAVTTADRPSIIFDPPRPIRLMVVTPDGPVIHLRVSQSDERRIITTIGPERIGPEWWHSTPDASPRDFFKVQDESGQWLWLSRELNTNRWYLAGEWT